MNFIDKADKVILKTYNRQPIEITHGEGVYLIDSSGKKYLDFGAGIAVNALGYSNTEFKNDLKNQIDKILHISNLYYSNPMIQAATILTESSGMDKAFFTNSGTEANEGALKVAKKYAFNKGIKNPEIIAFNNSFHGRSLGALSVTGNLSYREPFLPLIDGVKFADFNDFMSVEKLINEKTCAIIIEPIQGEGGITPAKSEFLDSIKSLCEKNDLLLIFDEIQCGTYRSGEIFAFQKYKIKPNILTLAKAIGCGIPVGAFLVDEKTAKNSLIAGDHGTTYGGNPFATNAIVAAFKQFKKLDILSHVKNIAPILESSLDSIVNDFSFVKERRGVGLLQGIELDSSFNVSEVINNARDLGLIILSAGKNTIRFAPPLVIEKTDIENMEKILREALKKLESK